MADGIDISRGGVIAVDTEVLRGVLPSFALASRHLLDCSSRLRSGAGALDAAAYQSGAEMTSSDVLFGLGHRMRRHADAVEAVATAVDATQAKVLLMAEAYEIVELRARLELLEREGARMVDVFRSELAARERENADASGLADELIATWESDRFAGFDDAAWQMTAFGLLSPVLRFAAALGHSRTVLRRTTTALQRGVHPWGAPKPPGWRPDVAVTTRSVRAATSPARLSEAVRRIPEGEAQVRVEKYTFADGSNQFAVYVDGTRAIAGDEPWNMVSNVDMYSGYAGASYEAVRQALSDAGATPGDTVHAFGYSQGGMITGLLATAGEFHVATHATIGSPTSPDVGTETTSIEIRHTDDLVSGLAGGGRMDGTGSPDSIVVTREAAPGLQAHDLGAGAHGREHYHETVRLLEESEDPRAHALDALWAELATAKNVEVTESHARIIEPTWDAIDLSGDGEPPATGASSSAGAGSPRTPH